MKEEEEEVEDNINELSTDDYFEAKPSSKINHHNFLRSLS